MGYEVVAGTLGIVCVALILWIVDLKRTTDRLHSEADRLR